MILPGEQPQLRPAAESVPWIIMFQGYGEAMVMARLV
jgi:hypothetical protein